MSYPAAAWRTLRALGVPLPIAPERAVTAPLAVWRRVLDTLEATTARLAAQAERTVCLDFDGTLTQPVPYTPGEATAPPRPGLLRALRALHAAGYRLVVLTARPPGEVHGWLHRHHVATYIDEVTNTKPPAAAYVDDRGVTFDGDWGAVHEEIERLQHTEPRPVDGNDAGTGLHAEFDESEHPRDEHGRFTDVADSPAFKAWFKDSTIVDEHGKPLVVYHGSPERGFTTFDKAKINPHDPDLPVNGFYFSSSEREATRAGRFPWGRPNSDTSETRPFYLSLHHPATREQVWAVAREVDRAASTHVTMQEQYPGARSLQDAVRMELQRRGFDGVVMEAYVAPDRARFEREGEVAVGKSGYVLRKDEEFGGVDLYRRLGPGKAELEHITGYENWEQAVEGVQHGQFVAFEPTQIKSARNRGTFDPKNPDITAEWDEEKHPRDEQGKFTEKRADAIVARLGAKRDPWTPTVERGTLPPHMATTKVDSTGSTEGEQTLGAVRWRAVWRHSTVRNDDVAPEKVDGAFEASAVRAAVEAWREFYGSDDADARAIRRDDRDPVDAEFYHPDAPQMLTTVFVSNMEDAGAGSGGPGSAKVFWMPYSLADREQLMTAPTGYNSAHSYGIDPMFVAVHELHHGIGAHSELDRSSDAMMVLAHCLSGLVHNPHAPADLVYGWVASLRLGSGAHRTMSGRLLRFVHTREPAMLEALARWSGAVDSHADWQRVVEQFTAIGKRTPKLTAEYEESEHPRDAHGRWTEGTGEVQLYRGESAYNRGGSYYTPDRDWARQFTQSGRDQEIRTVRIDRAHIYRPTPLPAATSEEDFDAAVAEAKQRGFKALWVDEGPGQPPSVFVLSRAYARTLKAAYEEADHPRDEHGLWVDKEGGPPPAREEFGEDIAEQRTEALVHDFDWQHATLAQLRQLADNVAWHGGKPDLCLMYPPLCQGSLGIEREAMPQITREAFDQMLRDAEQRGVAITTVLVPPSALRATQNEINAHRVLGLAERLNQGPLAENTPPAVISREGYIVDGHHRWAAEYLRNASVPMEAKRVDLPIREILALANRLSAPKRSFYGAADWDEAQHPRDEHGRWSDGIVAEGRAFVRPRAASTRYVRVDVDVAALDRSWQRDRGFYIGRGGTGNAIGTRYQRFGEFLTEGRPIEGAEIALGPEGEVRFVNGRHRFAYLRDHGQAVMPLWVPPEDAEAIRHRFGTTRLAAAADWDESQHPRDAKGEFTEKGGGGAKTASPLAWLQKGIRSAIEERPERRGHGYTGHNAFFVTPDGTIVPWHDAPRPGTAGKPMQGWASVHSHGSDSTYLHGAAPDTEDIDPMNSADIDIFRRQYRDAGLDTDVVIDAAGRMYVLRITPDTRPEFFQLKKKQLEDLLHGGHGETAYKLREKFYLETGGTTAEFYRQRLRDFADTFGLEYRDDLRWDMGKPLPALAPGVTVNWHRGRKPPTYDVKAQNAEATPQSEEVTDRSDYSVLDDEPTARCQLPDGTPVACLGNDPTVTLRSGADWDEAEHPRDEAGKFTDKGQGTSRAGAPADEVDSGLIEPAAGSWRERGFAMARAEPKIEELVVTAKTREELDRLVAAHPATQRVADYIQRYVALGQEAARAHGLRVVEEPTWDPSPFVAYHHPAWWARAPFSRYDDEGGARQSGVQLTPEQTRALHKADLQLVLADQPATLLDYLRARDWSLHLRGSQESYDTTLGGHTFRAAGSANYQEHTLNLYGTEDIDVLFHELGHSAVSLLGERDAMNRLAYHAASDRSGADPTPENQQAVDKALDRLATTNKAWRAFEDATHAEGGATPYAEQWNAERTRLGHDVFESIWALTTPLGSTPGLVAGQAANENFAELYMTAMRYKPEARRKELRTLFADKPKTIRAFQALMDELAKKRPLPKRGQVLVLAGRW